MSRATTQGSPRAVLFPTIRDDERLEEATASCDVTLEPAEVEYILQRCRQHGAESSYCLAAGWATILRQYTRNERVSVRWQQTGLVLSAMLASSRAIGDFLHSKGWDLQRGTDAQQVNTGIIVIPSPRVALDSEPDSLDCDIVLTVSDSSAGELTIAMHFRQSVLSRGQAQLLCRHLSQVMLRIVQHPERSAEDISRIDQPGSFQAEVIQQWMRTTRPIGGVEPVTVAHLLIHDQALANPSRTAIHAWDGVLSYAQLDDLSTRLGLHLQSLRIGPGQMVAVCCDKSVWAVVSLIAINKSGAAFVPLDPSHPRKRLEMMMQQVHCNVLLCSEEHVDVVAASHVSSRVVISEALLQALPNKNNTDNRAADLAEPRPKDPAYCLFTSGSTGAPRACLLDHAALASVSHYSPSLRIGPHSRALHFSSLAFGLSIIEIWCTLTAGATVCVPSSGDRVNRLVEVINEMDVNWVFMTPTILQLLHPDQVPRLRTVGIGGEPLPRAQRQVWADRVHLFQGLGMTEWAGTCTVSERIQATTSTGVVGSSTGARLWLVDPDDHHRLAPVGMDAELLIEGPSLARGYVDEPEQTAARFLSPPPAWFESMTGERSTSRTVFKTGDLVRYRADGSLQYVSRINNQTKLRGHRIELGEVEYQVKQALAVTDTGSANEVIADIIRPSAGEEPPILAVFLLCPDGVVAQANGPLDSRTTVSLVIASPALRDNIQGITVHLQEALPSYMVPSLYIPISHMPVTATGKTHRRRLREMAQQHSRAGLRALTDDGQPIQAPRTAAEHLLRDAVGQVLRIPVDQVGMMHEFLALGGDSLQAMKLVTLLRQHGAHLTVADVLKPRPLETVAWELGATEADLSEREAPKAYSLLGEMSGEPLDDILAEVASLCSVSVDEIEDVYPCTPMQQGMIALSTSRPGSMIARFQYHLKADLDVDGLKLAWQQVVKDNAILRTRIVQTRAAKTLQVVCCRDDALGMILADPGCSRSRYLEQVDRMPMGLGDRMVAAAVVAASDRPCDTTQQQLLLVVTIHHVLCDGSSMQLVMRQLEHLYLHGVSISPAPPPFCHFVRHLLRQQAAEKEHHQSFWQEYLRDFTTEPFPAVSTTVVRPVADQQLARRLRLAQAPTNCTMGTLLQAGWALVVAQHSTSWDVVFGATHSGRAASLPRVEEICGPIVATVPVRVVVDPREPVRELLARVQQQAVARLPFEQDGLQHIQRASPEAALACEFQSRFTVQPPWEDDQRCSSRFSETCEADPTAFGGFASTALSLECQLNLDPLNVLITAVFDTRALSTDLVEGLLHRFECILHEVVRDGSQPVGGVLSITPRDLAQIEAWHRRLQLPEPTDTVQRLFQRQVEQRPQSPAVCAWDGSLTYAELDALSSTVAEALASRDMVPEQVVPIYLEKSQWTAVAMLGVIKAGAAFTLMDASHPLERLQTLCRTVGARLVISSHSLEAAAEPLGTREKVICIEDLMVPMTTEAAAVLLGADRASQARQALCVVFTSGSTGQRKGAVLENGAYCCSVVARGRRFGMGPGARVLQFASHAFDVSVADILGTLVMGGCVCVPSELQRRNSLVQTARDELGVTHAVLTPSTVSALGASALTFLQVLVLCGEMRRPSDVEFLVQQPGLRVFSSYGPAECGVTTCATDVLQASDDPWTIGRPLASRWWLVDPHDHHRLLPPGAIGELVVDGPIVGRGYLHDAEKTAGSFITAPRWLKLLAADSPSRTSGARMYKTGDLARYTSDGSLQFHGRKDSQVKIRGHRIEATEVEAQVQRAFPRVQCAVVVAAALPGHANLTLVAFVQQQQQEEDQQEEPGVRGILLAPSHSFKRDSQIAEDGLVPVLPTYMMPTVFLPARTIPTTRSRKADRHRLRTIVQELTSDELRGYRMATEHKMPLANEEQRVLQAIWAAVLSVPDASTIGRHDHFVHLGGDSIRALEVSRMAQAQKWRLAVSDILLHPVLDEQARHLQSKDA